MIHDVFPTLRKNSLIQKAGLEGVGPDLGPFFVCKNMSGLILGEKSDSWQLFSESGDRIPVTAINTSPCFLIGVKSKEKNGYFSVKLGFRNARRIKKPVKGELKKAGIEAPLRYLREMRLEKHKDVTAISEGDKLGVQLGDVKIMVGQELNPEIIFKKGDKIDVTGTSKGKGFAGVVKRHHFKGGPRTHGQSDRERAPGSIGQTTTPGRVYKGKRMAGRMGGARVTVQGLEVIEATDTKLVVKGLVPGAKGSFLEIITAH